MHDLIRADILSGQFRPGQRLKFPELSERYGLSTGAVREALLRLVAKNLVSSEAHYGFRVTEVTAGGLADLTDLRTTIECLALRRAVGEGDLQWQGQVLASHHTFEQTPLGDSDEPSEDWLTAHADFHTALLAGCANPRLRNLAAALREEAELYRRWSGPPSSTATAQADRAAHSHHRELLDAIMARNGDRAVAILGRMIELTSTMTLNTQPQADLHGS